MGVRHPGNENVHVVRHAALRNTFQSPTGLRVPVKRHARPHTVQVATGAQRCPGARCAHGALVAYSHSPIVVAAPIVFCVKPFFGVVFFRCAQGESSGVEAVS